MSSLGQGRALTGLHILFYLNKIERCLNNIFNIYNEKTLIKESLLQQHKKLKNRQSNKNKTLFKVDTAFKLTKLRKLFMSTLTRTAQI